MMLVMMVHQRHGKMPVYTLDDVERVKKYGWKEEVEKETPIEQVVKEKRKYTKRKVE